MTQLVGEILGTMMLIILGDGVVANVLLSKTKGQGLSGGWPSSSGWIVITAGWCFAVMAGVFVAAATGSPQADLNPAVTIAKIIHGAGGGAATTAGDGVLRIVGEFIGAFIGGVVVWLSYMNHFEETQDKGLKLAVFCTAPNIRNYVMNVITEIVGTFVLVFVIYAIFSKAGPPVAGVGPFLVAALVWGIGLSLGGPTGYAINPARDLGPRIAHFVLPIPGKGDADWGYSWVPVVGPVIGGILAAIVAAAVGI